MLDSYFSEFVPDVRFLSSDARTSDRSSPVRRERVKVVSISNYSWDQKQQFADAKFDELVRKGIRIDSTFRFIALWQDLLHLSRYAWMGNCRRLRTPCTSCRNVVCRYRHGAFTVRDVWVSTSGLFESGDLLNQLILDFNLIIYTETNDQMGEL